MHENDLLQANVHGERAYGSGVLQAEVRGNNLPQAEVLREHLLRKWLSWK